MSQCLKACWQCHEAAFPRHRGRVPVVRGMFSHTPRCDPVDQDTTSKNREGRDLFSAPFFGRVAEWHSRVAEWRSRVAERAAAPEVCRRERGGEAGAAPGKTDLVYLCTGSPIHTHFSRGSCRVIPLGVVKGGREPPPVHRYTQSYIYVYSIVISVSCLRQFRVLFRVLFRVPGTHNSSGAIFQPVHRIPGTRKKYTEKYTQFPPQWSCFSFRCVPSSGV
jgi:hypothetical protein